MAFCINCGQKLPEGAKFCASCGQPVMQAGAPASGRPPVMQSGGSVSGGQAHMYSQSMNRESGRYPVNIKLNFANRKVLKGSQKATIYINGVEGWTGLVGNVATVYLNGPSKVNVKYHISTMYYGGMAEGFIDPSDSSDYEIRVSQSAFHLKLTICPVGRIEQ